MDFQQTLTRARSGDPEAIDEFLSCFYPRVQSTVHRAMAQDLRLKRPWLTAMFSTGDVVQEVFRSVIRDLNEFEGPNEAAFVAFLSALVKNRIVDAVRFHEALRRDPRRAAQAADQVNADDITNQITTDPAKIAQQNDEIQRVMEVLSTFPSRERILLQERLESAATFVTLAETLGYPSEDAARKAFYAAQAKLLIRLRPKQGGGQG